MGDAFNVKQLLSSHNIIWLSVDHTQLLLFFSLKLICIVDVSDGATLVQGNCIPGLHRSPEKAFLLRNFVLQAMQEVIRDGSYQHPFFESERCEIVVSSTSSPGLWRCLDGFGWFWMALVDDL